VFDRLEFKEQRLKDSNEAPGMLPLRTEGCNFLSGNMEIPAMPE